MIRARALLALPLLLGCGCVGGQEAVAQPFVIDIAGNRPPPKEVRKARPEPRQKPPSIHAALLDPSLAKLRAPPSFRVRFQTTQGSFTVEAVRKWAPRGVDRFYNLIAMGFFDNIAAYRVVKGFVVQFGINGDPAVNKAWKNAKLKADAVVAPNLRGTLTFAKAGPNSRTVQLFINLKDNPFLDTMGFAPIGRVIRGLGSVERFYDGYGDKTTSKQGLILKGGNAYLEANFPKLDYLRTAHFLD